MMSPSIISWLAVVTGRRASADPRVAGAVRTGRLACDLRVGFELRLGCANTVAEVTKHKINATEAIVLFTVAAPSLAKLASNAPHLDWKKGAAKFSQTL